MTKNNNNIELDALNNIRLLLIGPYPPPFGGIATHIRLLAPHLKTIGIGNLVVITFGNKNSDDLFEGVKVYRRNLKKNIFKLFFPQNIKLLLEVFISLRLKGLPTTLTAQEAIKAVIINEIFQKEEINFISSYLSNSSITLIPLKKYWKKFVPIILTVFGEIYEAPEFFLKHLNIIQELVDLCDHVMSSSQYCANSLKKIGIQRNIESIFYGVELSLYESLDSKAHLRNKNGIGHDEVVVFFMGRMLSDMGLDVFLNCIPRLIQRNNNCRFIIAGATGDLTEDAYKIQKKFPDKVDVFENISFANQGEVYKLADILVAPTFNQRACMGVSIKEAMAASLAVVAGAGGGISEAVIDGETGYLVPVDNKGKVDEDIFLQKIEVLILSQELRHKFGTAGNTRAKELFSVDKTNTRIAKLILDVNKIT